MRFASALTTKTDWAEAVEDLGRQVAAQLGPVKTDLAVLFVHPKFVPQIDALVDLGQGFLMLALLDQHRAQIDVRIAKVRIQRNRHVEIGGRLFGAAQHVQDHPPIVIGPCPVLPAQHIVLQRAVADHRAFAQLIAGLGMVETVMGKAATDRDHGLGLGT